MINANAPVVVVEIGKSILPLVSNLEVAVASIGVAAVASAGTVASVNSVLPDLTGNVVLTPADIGAADALGTDDNYVTDVEKLALHAPGSDDQDLSGLVPFTTLDAIKDPTGFLAPAGITVTGEHATRTVTLTGDLRYLWRGVLNELTAPYTFASTHPIGDGPYYLYSSDGTTFTWSASLWPFDSIHVARYYKGRYFRECHGTMPWTVHYNLHHSKSHGTQYLSGGSAIAGTFTLNTAGNIAVTPDFATATILDEDLPSTIPSVVAGQYCQLYFSGARVDNQVTSQAFPYRVGTSYPLINQVSGGIFSEVETTTGRYLNIYQFLVPAAADAISQEVRMMFLQPQTSFSSLEAAIAEPIFSLDVQGLGGFATELVPFSRLTYLTGASYTATGKVRLMSITEVTGKLNVSGVGSAATTAGNILTTPFDDITALTQQATNEEIALKRVKVSGGRIRGQWNDTVSKILAAHAASIFPENESNIYALDLTSETAANPVVLSYLETLILEVGARTTLRFYITTGASVPAITWQNDFATFPAVRASNTTIIEATFVETGSAPSKTVTYRDVTNEKLDISANIYATQAASFTVQADMAGKDVPMTFVDGTVTLPPWNDVGFGNGFQCKLCNDSATTKTYSGTVIAAGTKQPAYSDRIISIRNGSWRIGGLTT